MGESSKFEALKKLARTSRDSRDNTQTSPPEVSKQFALAELGQQPDESVGNGEFERPQTRAKSTGRSK